MTNKYKVEENKFSLPKIEHKVLEFWKKNNIFEQTLQKNTKENFVFYDGPPFANGLPHYGHLLTGFIKDTVARYQTSRGKKVNRRFGWDCHGLPVEMQTEKELKITGRSEIVQHGIDKFNKACETSVMKYAQYWRNYVDRQGRWVDMDNDYKSMNKNYMESVLWVFKELYNKGLVYESLRVMPYSYACETPLSNFETRMDNAYRERVDKAVTVRFEVKSSLDFISFEYNKCYLLAWTTTPWTLPSNLALAVSKDMNLAVIQYEGDCYILGDFALGAYKKEFNEDKITSKQVIKGEDILGVHYIPIFNYFHNHANAFKVLYGEFVQEGEGTGVVHLAPGFGEDDQILCDKENIELVCPVDDSGCFTKVIHEFQGQNVFDANQKIIDQLKQEKKVIKIEQYLHDYPHCWRTDTPLIYKAVSSWYIKVTELKSKMQVANQNINWIPSNIKDGLFGKWLDNIRDWSISRNRFWGTPIPIWKSDDEKYPRIDVYGSIEELEKDFGVKIHDLHRQYIDQLTRANPDDPTGKSIMRRVEDVFDCWFESGSMPYAQVHYPFENKSWFEENFPADFIVEYSAQTRGWFYTLLVLSTAIFDSHPFKNCIAHGVILDATGRKLSKRLNNYKDPIDIFEEYGSDAMRIMMLASSVTKGHELLIDKNGKDIHDTVRLFINPIWNAYYFFVIYANIDNVNAVESFVSNNVLDQYIIYKLKNTIEKIQHCMDQYDMQSVCKVISNFFEVLNNWYIRRSRNRFWHSEVNHDKKQAYNTLYSCLMNIAKASASLLPMLTEHIYQSLTRNNYDNSLKSIHLTDFPLLQNVVIDKHLLDNMDLTREICNAALFIRNQNYIRIRQPLSKLVVITNLDPNVFSKFVELIQDEVNVKVVEFQNNLNDYCAQKVSIDFAILAQRIPHKIKSIITEMKQDNWRLVNKKLLVAEEELNEEEYNISLLPKKDIQNIQILKDNNTAVLLDVTLDKNLIYEGIARDLIRFIQQKRKDNQFEISDRINVYFKSNNKDFDKVITEYNDIIIKNILANEITEQQDISNGEIFEYDQYKVFIILKKVI